MRRLIGNLIGVMVLIIGDGSPRAQSPPASRGGMQVKSLNANVVLIMPADDCQNAGIIDGVMHELKNGADIVCAGRLMYGGSMKNCPLLKNILVRFAGFTLHYFAHLPTHDAINRFRLFSKKLLEQIQLNLALNLHIVSNY